MSGIFLKLSELKEYNEELYDKAIANTLAEEDQEFVQECIDNDELVFGCFLINKSKEGTDFWCDVLDEIGESKK